MSDSGLFQDPLIREDRAEISALLLGSRQPADRASSPLLPRPRETHASVYGTTHALGDDPSREQHPFPIVTPPADPQMSPLPGSTNGKHGGKTLYILLPVFIILFTLLVLLIVFLIGIIYSKRRRGIRLIEDGGPLDLSRNDGVIGEGGIEGVESRWLEQVSEDVRQGYQRGKGKFETQARA